VRSKPTLRRIAATTVSATVTVVIASAPTMASPSTATDLVGTTSCTQTSVVEPSAPALVPMSLPDGLRHDLARSAEQENITLVEAIARYAWHEDFSAVVSSVRDTLPEHFTGARIEDDGVARAWVAFAGTAPIAAMEMLSASPVPVAIREQCGYTEAELKDRLEEVHYSIFEQQEVVADVSSAYDVETGVITVLVEPTGTAASLRGAQLRDDLAASLPTGLSTFPVDLQVVDDARTGEDLTIIGGRALSSCTTGFNVVGSSYRGTTTAGHCPNSLTYSGYSLTFMSEHEGNFGDLQWHRRSGATFPNQFDAGPSIRGVFGTGTAVEGQRLCRNGKTTGYNCDDVYQLNHCNGSRCGLVAMRNRYAEGGDSGGPWFYNNTAYGIHQGGKYWNLKWRDLYTPVVYLPSALDD
jgi:streptogrisin C